MSSIGNLSQNYKLNYKNIDFNFNRAIYCAGSNCRRTVLVSNCWEFAEVVAEVESAVPKINPHFSIHGFMHRTNNTHQIIIDFLDNLTALLPSLMSYSEEVVGIEFDGCILARSVENLTILAAENWYLFERLKRGYCLRHVWLGWWYVEGRDVSVGRHWHITTRIK